VPGCLDEVVHEVARALVSPVGEVEAPRVVHGLAGLQGQGSDLRVLVEVGGAAAGQVLLEHLEVLARKGTAVMVVADEGGRLQLVDHPVRLREPPVRVRLVPPPVEPDATDLAVVREQLAELAVHVVEVAVPVALGRPPAVRARAPARVVVGVMPVELRVVEEELDALPVALVGQHLEDVLLVGRAVHDVVVGDLGVEHREAVVMLAGDGDVLHARGLGHGHPFRGVELRGVEQAGQLLVIGHADAALMHHPLAVGERAVHAPVHEEAELGVLEGAPRLHVGGRGLVLGGAGAGERRDGQDHHGGDEGSRVRTHPAPPG
jgi:hypothetical protein